MKLKTVMFRSIDSIYNKERTGIKPNTVRVVDWKDERFRILALMALGYEPMGYVKIKNTEHKGINFTRKIKDVTFFGDIVIVSWEIIKVMLL